MGSINDDEVSVVAALETLTITDDGEFRVPEKDPRTIARGYQIELCQKALMENIIVYLETGCGKTHIAVLLIYETIRRMQMPKKDICIFLAPTVALVEQQAKVIGDSIDVKVGIYCGKGHHDWQKEMEQFEVLVMTPEILLHKLSHCFIRIQHIALLIFDECHYAQVESSHPYAEIMKIFYKPDVAKLPRIFGMTASPIYGKGASISSLETLLNAKVYTVDSRAELDQFVSSPIVNCYYYGTDTHDSPDPRVTYLGELEKIKVESMVTLSKNIKDFSILKNTKKALQRFHCNIGFCLDNLGLWGALQACRILLKGDLVERNEVIEVNEQCSDDIIYGSYLPQVAKYFDDACKKDGIAADLASMDNLRVPFFSLKLLQLVKVLSNFRAQPDMKCIVFVNRIITARSLAYILQQIRVLSAWRCSYLVGVHSGLKNMSRKTTNAILERFRSGELNLLVATKVGEEGLDIQTCCLVIRFDLPETVASFIQSRGRARMPQSEYAFLVDRGNPREMDMITNFHKNEVQMNDEISSRTSTLAYVDFEEKTYKVDSTGAIISSGSSVSLLHRYCSKLPHDEFFNPRPTLSYSNENADATICHITLPANAPIHQIVSSPQPSREAAKKDACLKACQRLHELGALTHYLLPDDELDENQDSADSDGEDEDSSRRELHEMLVPSVFQEPWTKVGNTSKYLNSYFIKLDPSPADRLYKNFGIFIKKTFPQEAERMELDIQLARGRSVLTKIVPCGTLEFTNNEILLAERFQEMWLKAIIDKSEFVKDFVQLGKDDFTNSASTHYLLLPVCVDNHCGSMTVDWQLITKCLSSPIFKNPEDTITMTTCHQPSNMNDCLYLANGPTNIKDVLDSLVYVPCKDTFYFVSECLPEKNYFSIFKEETSYLDHYAKVFGSQFEHPNQPLLKAKQLFRLDNLLRKKGSGEPREKEEHFVELPPEVCVLKIIGFSRDIGSTLSILPSMMYRLESFLVAIELRQKLCASFSQGSQVSADRILEALTTERCNEWFSLERLEILGDAFLKFAVGRHFFLVNPALDEGILTRKRSNMVNNSHLLKLALANNLQVYIRDQPFEPSCFYPFGRRCPTICTDSTKVNIHSSHESNLKTGATSDVRCNKGHHWLQKKTIADIVEALVGAFLVDSGFKAAIAFLKWIGIPVDFRHSHVTDICASSKTFTPLSALIDISALENLLGYQFQHKGLLLQALLHPSFQNNFGGCYQRLEYLGDAVLDYLITSYLYSVYPKLKPGHLTDLRSYSVNNNSFAGIAVNRSFYKFMLCDSTTLTHSVNKYVEFFKTSSSNNVSVETVPCPKALGDLVESCVGAILLDSGFNLDLVWKIMISFLDSVMKFSALQQSPIREFQELCQFYNWEIKYSSVKKDRLFTFEARVDEEQVCASASATNFSKKTAKRMACQDLCLALKDKGYKTSMKSLEEILQSCQKMEAKLIGYDEIPTNVKSIESGSQSQETRSSSANVIPERSSNGVIRMVGPTPQCSRMNSQAHAKSSSSQAPTGDVLHKASAKSHLYEICAINCWKPPLFECFQEIGPAHLKQFAFKVSFTVEDASNTLVECIGDHRAKKKEAAEFAAQGAIWYLKQTGHLKK